MKLIYALQNRINMPEKSLSKLGNFINRKFMIMKKTVYIVLFLILPFSLYSQKTYPEIVLETTKGDLVFELYLETPMHSDNFLKLVKEGYYDGLLFHRVISAFMIQSGDPNSKNAKPGERLGNGGPGYTIPAEFNLNYYHKKGALAAARMGDHVNPNKESSGSQFYVVQGRTFTPEELSRFTQSGKHIPFSQEQIEVYSSAGGTPHLDYEYTVFGELTEGFDVLDKIASSETDRNDRPLTDVKIIKAYPRKK
jgi:peptidyl-prolyl cis-trans isomerase B (cyclophilin B)